MIEDLERRLRQRDSGFDPATGCMMLPDPLSREAADTIARLRAEVREAYRKGFAAGVRDVAIFVEGLRQDVPAHGWEMAAAIRQKFLGQPEPEHEGPDEAPMP